MKKVNLDTWERRKHYAFFKALDVPQYDMTFQIDVTPLYRFVKKEGISFYFTMIYIVMSTLNDIEAFKYRIIDNEVYIADTMHPSFTDVMANSHLFKMVTTEMTPTLTEFLVKAKENSAKQLEIIDPIKENMPNLVYITSFPWASFTSATNAVNVDSSDAIPRIGWGKYYPVGDLMMIPLNLRVHHGFVDGYHVGVFLEKLQLNMIDKLKM